jgi:hypothetical protein
VILVRNRKWLRSVIEKDLSLRECGRDWIESSLTLVYSVMHSTASRSHCQCSLWITAWSKLILKKLIYLQLVKKFRILYKNMSFVIVFKTACHLSWYWRRYRVQDSRHLSRSSCLYRVQDSTQFFPILTSLSCSRKLAFCPDIDIVIAFTTARLLSQFWRRVKGTVKRSKNCRIFCKILSFFQ